jgi:hypothetical protein
MPNRRFSLPLLYMMIGIQSASHAQVVTAQYDNFRTGADLNETVLKPSNVNTRDFGKRFSRTVDGDVFAQPLNVPSLAIPGVGKRSVVFAATEHDSVYAFDVNGTRDAPLWKTSFVDPQHGITTLTRTRCALSVYYAGGRDYSDTGDRRSKQDDVRAGADK